MIPLFSLRNAPCIQFIQRPPRAYRFVYLPGPATDMLISAFARSLAFYHTDPPPQCNTMQCATTWQRGRETITSARFYPSFIPPSPALSSNILSASRSISLPFAALLPSSFPTPRRSWTSPIYQPSSATAWSTFPLMGKSRHVAATGASSSTPAIVLQRAAAARFLVKRPVNCPPGIVSATTMHSSHPIITTTTTSSTMKIGTSSLGAAFRTADVVFISHPSNWTAEIRSNRLHLFSSTSHWGRRTSALPSKRPRRSFGSLLRA